MKGRPILGVISGFLFGFLLGVSLFLWGVIPLHSDLLWILPLFGIVLGLVMAWWAPFGRSSEQPLPVTSPPVTSPPVESVDPEIPEPGPTD